MGRVKVDQLAEAIAAELTSYRQEIADGLKQDVRAAAREARDRLRGESPKDTGDYRKGWSDRVAFERNDDIRAETYNRTDSQLTHLLENGHAKRKGGRVEARVHIKTAAEEAQSKLLGRTKARIRG